MKRNKILKKAVSLLLMVAMLGTVATVFSGCGIFSKKVIGTEAAKILLARERLDADTVGQKMNIFSTGGATAETEESFFSKIFPWASIGPVGYIGSRPLIVSNIASGAEVNGDRVTWSNFQKYSDLQDSYTQFITPIDQAAADTAELIAKIKEDVGITDKWIDTTLAKYMLIVDGNSETIIEYYKPFNSISVSTRYTREDAKNVYEMYSFMSYEDGTTGDIRNKCIPGEYYEYACRNSGGFIDYFIADKSLGYWMMNRFDIKDDSAFFDMSAVKGDIGYGASVSSRVSNGKLVHSNSGMSVSMFLPNEDGDLFEITALEDTYIITMFMSNVESGIDSLSANRSSVYDEVYGGSGTVYLYGSHGDVSDTVDINLSNGKVIKVGDSDSGVTYESARISYSPEYNGDTYIGRLRFKIEAQNETEAFDTLYSYLDKNGIKLRVKGATVIEAYNHCKLLHDNFDVMEWYGLRLDSIENLKAGEARLIEDFNHYRNLYEEVKDYETVRSSYDVARSTDFGKMTISSEGTSTYANGIISLKDFSASTENTPLLETGMEYTLKVGLALRDSEGKISSVNTVSLESANEKTVSYTDGTLEMTQTADYTVPTALSEGEYIVVVYFATAENGIRVTEMFPVAFFSAEEGIIESDFMDVTVTRSGNNLFIDYGVKLKDTVTSDYVKESYTYDEIKTILIRGILAKGYPIGDAVVQTEAGEALNGSESYGAGVYRLKYLVNTEVGLVEAYMYCTLETK